MFFQIVLYVHLLAATAWIGGALFLFALGIFMRDKDAQRDVYHHLGPIYGYFEVVWLILLWATGAAMFDHFDMIEVFAQAGGSQLAYAMDHKLRYVVLITILTFVHMYVALKTRSTKRTLLQNIISRGSSLFIFFANLGILWFAIQLREILS